MWNKWTLNPFQGDGLVKEWSPTEQPVDHFRVDLYFSFKASLRTKSYDWKRDRFTCHVNELTFGTHFQGTEAKGHTHGTRLQCTVMVVLPDCCCHRCTWPMISINPVPESGDPTSGHPVYWYWRTTRDALSYYVNNSNSTLDIMLLWRTRKICKTFCGQL